MPYWRAFYHIVWATKNRQPLVMPDVETMIYGFIQSKAIALGGTVFALNGISDHVHLVTSIPPSIAVSTFVGQVKGVASTRFNKSGIRETPLFWQDSYGVFTFDHKRLPNLIAYVQNQKKHHADQNTLRILERMDDQDASMLREPDSVYVVQDDLWWQEMTELGLE